ncbi:MAG: Asp-tRNA(Asn)/Glu-tRNA(Gln) amidotransferase subunit GatC [Rickettsiaceae bacterium]|nr:MAG: Asp-tRNA(Asn)/Glu-tRNA(Gln) amidotransferase subunit GatC [Rickettsiaceae bacterium]
MLITNQEVKRVANLVKLVFDENEMSHMAVELTDIINMIDLLKEVDCDEVEPLTSVSSTDMRMRADTAEIADISDQLFANTPGSSSELAKKTKCFVVPKVV